MTAVSREALAEPERITRRYRSHRRQRNAEATRQALVDAALKLVGEGNFRPEGREVAALVGCEGSLLTYYFGGIEGLCRQIAEHHAEAVLSAAGLEPTAPEAAHVARGLAWIIMVGRKRSPS
jgi:AcrR family transcriptional regulator